jgi:hypothetical protein
MNETNDIDILGRLFAEIERAWVDDKDHAAVYRLSREYPQFRDELHEFFGDLILGPEGNPGSDVRRAEDNVHRWILASGLNIAKAVRSSALRTTTAVSLETKQPPETAAADAAPAIERTPESGDTWVAFLRRHTHLKLPQVAAGLPHVTTEYLVLVSRHPVVVPASVKKELAGYTEEKFGIRRQDSLQCLTGERSFRRAASRSHPFDREPATFKELLDRAALDPDQKAFWLNCAERA